MGLRLALSKLASAEAREGAARALVWLCVAGFALTMIIVVAAGGAGHRWFFILLVWALFVYAPLRILLEAAQTLAPALRRRLIAETSAGAGGYATRAAIELTVDGLFEREVVMPRIATPVQTAKAKAGAIAVLARTDRLDALEHASGVCVAAVDRWATGLSQWAAQEAGQNIQLRWSEVRALAAMTAMSKILVAAYADRGGTHLRKPSELLDACFDYCDDLALDVDVPAWREGLRTPPPSADRAEDVRQAWKVFCETGAPALEARHAFVELMLSR